MSDRVQQLSLFVRAVETGNFSRTGREFGMSQPSVSRNIAELEQRLGVKLLLRTTRSLTPTEAGTALYERAKQALESLDDAESAARGADSLSGTLRLSLPVAFGTREVAPLLPGFLDRHRDISIDMLMSDRFDDLVAEGVDLALRLGPQRDSSFVTRRIASVPRLMVAAPSYLERHGRPATPSDLSQHECLRGPGDGDEQGLVFRRGESVISVAIGGRVRVSSAGGLVACAMAGLGLMAASLWMCRRELAEGTLVPVLEDFTLEPMADAYVVFPGGRQPSRKARAFVDYLTEALRR